MSTELGKSILVTGGTGFVGSHVVERLIALGAHVRCLARRTSSMRYLPHTGIELVTGDLAGGEGLAQAVNGADVVLHIAGVTKARSETEYFSGNAVATRNLLRACENAPVPPKRFVHVSSLAAMGPNPDSTPISEDAAPKPLTWYGQSKLAAETAVRRSPLAQGAIILRPPVVYGPRDTDVFQLFKSISRGFMTLIGSGDSWFSYVHVDDLAGAIVNAAFRPKGGGTYFVANPEPVSWRQFGTLVASALGRGVRFIAIPPGAAYAVGWLAEIASMMEGKPGIISRQKILEAQCRYWTCDASRAAQELEFTPARSLRDGITNTLHWYKEAGWLKF